MADDRRPTPRPGASAATPATDAPATRPARRSARGCASRTHGQRQAPAAPPKLDNPLREGLRLERVPDPLVLVLFGATGDLAHRKVIPALYQLWRTNLLPHEFMLVAVGRRPYDDDVVPGRDPRARSSSTRGSPLDAGGVDEFLERIVYHQGDFDDPDGVRPPGRRGSTRSTRSAARAATGSSTSRPSRRPFAEIVAQLGRVGLDHEHHGGGWRRIVIEKPFGRDLDSAIRLNREVGKVFRESQVYRIDHYLGKETVRNLLVFRFGNGIFEPLWNRRYVDHVQITVAESIGVENRGAFYEETGASRDVLQNHLLQLLSSSRWSRRRRSRPRPCATRRSRCSGRSRRSTPDEVAADVVRGQYGPGWVAAQPVAGYRAGAGGRPGVRDRDVRRGPVRRSTTGAGPASRSTSGPASGCRSARPRSRSSSSAVPHRLFRDSAGRPRAEPARDPDPARRGHPAALRRQGPRASASTSAR